MSPGDVVDVDFGVPTGREAGFNRPCVVIANRRLLDLKVGVVAVVPCSTTQRGWAAEVATEGYGVAQCWLVSTPSVLRLGQIRGNVGPVALRQIRETVGDLLDIFD